MCASGIEGKVGYESKTPSATTGMGYESGYSRGKSGNYSHVRDVQETRKLHSENIENRSEQNPEQKRKNRKLNKNLGQGIKPGFNLEFRHHSYD